MPKYAINNFYPADGYFVTKIIEGQQYKGKIIMPDTIKEPYRYGEVVKCGEEKEGQTVKAKNGDILLFGHKAGFDLLIGSDKYVCIAADQCVGHYDMRFYDEENEKHAFAEYNESEQELPGSVKVDGDEVPYPYDDGSPESYKP